MRHNSLTPLPADYGVFFHQALPLVRLTLAKRPYFGAAAVTSRFSHIFRLLVTTTHSHCRVLSMMEPSNPWHFVPMCTFHSFLPARRAIRQLIKLSARLLCSRRASGVIDLRCVRALPAIKSVFFCSQLQKPQLQG